LTQKSHESIIKIVEKNIIKKGVEKSRKKGESFKYFENGLRYGDNGMDKMKEHTKIKSKD